MSQHTATPCPAAGGRAAGTGRRIGAAWRGLLFRAHRMRVGIDRRIGEAVVRGVAASPMDDAPMDDPWVGRYRLGAGSRREGIR